MLYDAEGFHSTAPVQLLPATDWSAARPLRAPDVARLLQHAGKRGLDIAASLALILLLTPLLIAVAAAILLVDRSQPIFRQDRYGRGGVPFKILKFRTMICAESGADFVQARRADDRITRLGAFLRRTSLDELPQLFNVLAGEMSLVGPRPHALAMEDENFAAYPRAMRRLAVRPGMTGLAQIRGLRGPTDRPEALKDRLDADVAYVNGWSLWKDVRILALTPAAWLLGKNAF